MKDLLIRCLSGLLYISLIVSTLFIDKTLTLLIFGTLGALCLREFLNLLGNLSQPLHYLTLYLLLFIGLISLYNQENSIFAPTLLIASCLFNLFIAYQLFMHKEMIYSTLNIISLSVLYLIGGIIFMASIAFSNLEVSYKPELLLAIFLLIWTNDSFAYLVGVTLGKRKLFPSVSPKKSVEGFIGGLLGTLIVAFIIGQYFYTEMLISHWIIIGIVASVFGTIGDLIQSKLKRKAGVKDSGKIMPGHGGIYDRLDSIIYASPFIFAYLFFVI